MKQYATYIRVSTQRQGKSGLGLDSQRKMCSDFITANNGIQATEFVDVQSGTHRDRKGLQNAIAYCKKNDCGLVIAKLDRLARDVEFCFRVVNTGIDIHFCDFPTMNTLLLGVFASVAQYERELTSDRTKKALAVKKAQGAKLGASNEKYRINYDMKSETIKKEESMKRGITKSRRVIENRDTQAMFRILKRVFPKYTEGTPNKWRWTMIGTRNGAWETIVQMMQDFKEMDESGATFHKWDFASMTDRRKSQQKIGAYIKSIEKGVTREFNEKFFNE